MEISQIASRARIARQKGDMVQLLANQTFKPDYHRIVQRFSSTQAWFRFMTEQLPEKLAILGKERVAKALIETLYERYPHLTRTDLGSPRVSFATLNPRVIDLIGGDMLVPYLIFDYSYEFRSFMLATEKKGKVTGVCLDLPCKSFAKRLGVNLFGPVRDLSVISHNGNANRSDRLVTIIHEQLHAIDPYLSKREEIDDGLLLSEVVPIVISFGNRLIPRDVFFGHAKDAKDLTDDFLKAFRLSPRGFFSPKFAAQAMTVGLARLIKRNGEEKVLRLLMECVDFKEAYKKLKRLDPGYYSDPGTLVKNHSRTTYADGFFYGPWMRDALAHFEERLETLSRILVKEEYKFEFGSRSFSCDYPIYRQDIPGLEIIYDMVYLYRFLPNAAELFDQILDVIASSSKASFNRSNISQPRIMQHVNDCTKLEISW